MDQLSISTVIVVGSARSPGNTHQLVLALADAMSADIINLNDYEFGGFDYEFKNKGDDFPPLIRKILSFDRIIFASPVYWYASSAIMKKFMDRMSDLLKIEKDLGRQLRTKKAALVATGSDVIPASSFEAVFQLTFEYLGMHYQGMLYAHCEKDFSLTEHADAIVNFARNLHAA
jgi:multimeric flavodoxin WrbA